MPLTVTTLVGLLGALQGVILAGAIASMGGSNRRPNQFLALIVLVLSVVVASVVAEHARLGSCSICWVLVEYTSGLLMPPLLWYYTDLVLGVRSRVPIIIHFLPFIVWVAYLVSLTLGLIDLEWRWIPPILVLVVYLVSYTVAIAFRTWRASNKSQALISHSVVLRALIGSLIVLHGAQLVRFVYRELPTVQDIVPVTGAIIIYAMSFLAFRQSRLFAGHESSATKRKYESSTLTPERVKDIESRLLLVMENEKPYLNEYLNIAELASRLSVSRSHLSQVINSELDTRFSEMLNRYRVAEALRLLGDEGMSHLTIEAIGYEVGFRSRSGFYSAFKRIAGETPANARSRLS